MERVDAAANELIIRQDDPGGYYYVIEEGYCDVARQPAGGGREIHLAELGPGDGFGEEALVSDTPRNASVTMRSNGVLMRLDKESFIELIRDPLLHKVSYQDARRMIDEGAVWIDIRHRDQFARGSFRNARNVPRAEDPHAAVAALRESSAPEHSARLRAHGTRGCGCKRVDHQAGRPWRLLLCHRGGILRRRSTARRRRARDTSGRARSRRRFRRGSPGF